MKAQPEKETALESNWSIGYLKIINYIPEDDNNRRVQT
jgi:hypothetical protein